VRQSQSAGRPEPGTRPGFHDALQACNPDRLLWGSDWPHLRMAPAPNALELLKTCRRWTASEPVFGRIMKLNPAALYG